jgi:hypothetical protein
MEHMTNLVISWCNYTWDKSKIFVKSLRKTGYDGSIVFIEGTHDEFTLSKYKEYGVVIEPCGKSKREIMDAYVRVLSISVDIDDRVFLSDARDVVFQSNPFSYIIDNELHLTSEDLKIKEQHLNRFWIQQEFGNEVASLIGENQVLNAGIMYGGIEPIKEWVSKLMIFVPKVEQAVLNYLYWTGLLSAIVEPNTGHRIVWTIGTKIDTDKKEFYVLDDGIITTLDDVVPPVIHQYDRHKKIKDILEKLYADQ